MDKVKTIIFDPSHQLSIDDFYSFFPELRNDDPVKYPDNIILEYMKLGRQFVNFDLWGDSWTYGICLFVAHELVLAFRSTENNDGTPGLSTGIVSGKSVGPISKSYDTNFAKYDDAGYFNLTTYGQRYWYFKKIYGMSARMQL